MDYFAFFTGLKFGGTDEESREAAPQADQNSVSLPMGGQPQYAGPLPGTLDFHL